MFFHQKTLFRNTYVYELLYIRRAVYFILSAFPTLQSAPIAGALFAQAHIVGPAGVIFLHSDTVVGECILRSFVTAPRRSAFSGR